MPSWDVICTRLPGTPLRVVLEHRLNTISILQQSEFESEKLPLETYGAADPYPFSRTGERIADGGQRRPRLPLCYDDLDVRITPSYSWSFPPFPKFHFFQKENMFDFGANGSVNICDWPSEFIVTLCLIACRDDLRSSTLSDEP